MPSLERFLSEFGAIRIYGQPLDPEISIELNPSMTIGADGASFVVVRAFAIKNTCRVLPTSIILALPGKGDEPNPNDECAHEGDLVWSVPASGTTVALQASFGTVENLLRNFDAREGERLGFLRGDWYVRCPNGHDDLVTGFTSNHDCEQCGRKAVDNGHAVVVCPVGHGSGPVSGITESHICMHCGRQCRRG